MKRGGAQGSDARTWISGWINAFFSFDEEGRADRQCEAFVGGDQYSKYVEDHFHGRHPVQKGLEVGSFPKGLSNAPVSLDGIVLEFQSGFNSETRIVVACNLVSAEDGRLDVVKAEELHTRIGLSISLFPFAHRRGR